MLLDILKSLFCIKALWQKTEKNCQNLQNGWQNFLIDLSMQNFMFLKVNK